MTTPLDRIRALGWSIEITEQQGLPYYRARRDGWRRAQHDPALLLEDVERATRHLAPPTPIQLRLPLKEAA